MPDFETIDAAIPVPLADVITVALAVAAALLLHALLMAIARRVAARTPASSDDLFVAAACRPLRWIMVAVALASIRRFLALSRAGDQIWTQLAGLIVPALLGCLAIAIVRAMQRAVDLRFDITVADNLRARRRRTRSAILGRIAIVAIGFVTICLMLLSIPSIRSIGVTLMASAGLAGLAVGAAAQPALKNIIAGIQMAFTEPIRIDDVVIVEGEWGRVEEIRLTYIVLALWDERRLIVPVAKFLEEPFQNWTRTSSQLLGAAFFWLDPKADIARLRTRCDAIVRADPKWDGRAFAMQVTDTKPEAIEVRVLATARNAGDAFDLRCDVREALLAFIREDMPEALPRQRLVIDPGFAAPEAAAASG